MQQRNDGTVDFHTHPVTDTFRREMEYLGIDPLEEDGFPLPAWNAKMHLDFMEKAGIGYSVLSVPTPHMRFGGGASEADVQAWIEGLNL